MSTKVIGVKTPKRTGTHGATTGSKPKSLFEMVAIGSSVSVLAVVSAVSSTTLLSVISTTLSIGVSGMSVSMGAIAVPRIYGYKQISSVQAAISNMPIKW